jgi:hypothetical protein
VRENRGGRTTRIVVCGHSLGGGYSKLLAIDLINKGHPVELLRCVTFGAPMVLCAPDDPDGRPEWGHLQTIVSQCVIPLPPLPYHTHSYTTDSLRTRARTHTLPHHIPRICASIRTPTRPHSLDHAHVTPLDPHSHPHRYINSFDAVPRMTCCPWWADVIADVAKDIHVMGFRLSDPTKMLEKLPGFRDAMHGMFATYVASANVFVLVFVFVCVCVCVCVCACVCVCVCARALQGRHLSTKKRWLHDTPPIPENTTYSVIAC